MPRARPSWVEVSAPELWERAGECAGECTCLVCTSSVGVCRGHVRLCVYLSVAHSVCARVHVPGGQMCECGCAWESSTTLVCLSVLTPCVHVCMCLVGRCASVGVPGGHVRLSCV